MPPDENEWHMISLAAEYLHSTLPRLPDFHARRTSVRYDGYPQYDEGSTHVDPEPLHAVDHSRVTVPIATATRLWRQRRSNAKRKIVIVHLWDVRTASPCREGCDCRSRHFNLEPLGEERGWQRAERGVSGCRPATEIAVSGWRVLSS